ncbi:MAG: NAD(P)/FAD-dependent oxidoreductase [Solirubrobacterales bacterium]|nr:NAD(P)/FAD-dependent oxidoreductase [Solirubrobacterales bacterium]
MSIDAGADTSRAEAMNRTGPWDAIVVGSGLSGLTSAAYLAANGKKVLVLEQYDVAGGCSQTFRRKNEWQFDVGLHYIGGVKTGDISRVLKGLGLHDRIDFVEMDPDGFDTFVFPDFEFRVPKGWDNYLDRLVETFPDEEEGLRQCVGTFRDVVGDLAGSGIPGVDTDLADFVARAPNLVAWGMRSITELFDECGLGERSRAVLTGHAGDYATPPSRTPVVLHASLVDHYMQEGAFYVRGGGQVLPGHLIDVIHSNGGRVRTHAEVASINVVDGTATGVTLSGDETIEAPIVISTADIKRTFLDLLDPEVLPDGLAEIVDGYRMATPLVCVYLGLDFDLAERMPNTNYWRHSRYDSEEYYDFVAAEKFDPDPPVYITSASAKDPGSTGHAPEGCSTVELMTWATPSLEAWGVESEEAAGKYSKQEGYLAAKDKIVEQLIDSAEEILGELRPHILWKEAATPMTQTRYTQSTDGSSYGIELATDQFGPLRPDFKTAIDGLFLAGVSTRRGHGIVGAMNGGVESASAVLGRNLRHEIQGGAVFGDISRLTAGGEGWDALEACRKLQDKSARRIAAAAV